MAEIIYKELSYKIIQAVYEVHSILGTGFPESVYENAVCKELKSRSIKYERQKPIEILYKDDKVGDYRLDLLVEDKIILEIKAVSELNDVFKAQLYSYLKATGLRLGILINFGSAKLEYKRIVN